jgi:hypothetical protein
MKKNQVGLLRKSAQEETDEIDTLIVDGVNKMSQKKVDEYKKFKANRKKIFEKEKKMRKVRRVLGVVIAVAVIGGFGYWGYYSYQVANKPEVSFSSLITQNSYGFILPTATDASN